MIKGFINLSWFCFKWGLLLLAVAALVAVPFFYRRMDEEIRLRVETKLSNHYRHLTVKVRSAHLVQGEGIEVRGISIFEPGAEGPQAELLTIDDAFIACGTDLRDLAADQLQVTHYTLRRATLRATRRRDGTWSTARLAPLPRFSNQALRMTLENAKIEIFDPTKNPSSTLVLRDGNLQIGPVDTPQATPDADTPLRIRGHVAADHVRHVELDAVFDPLRNTLAATGTIDGLEVSPELCRAMPGQQRKPLTTLEALRAQAGGRFRISYNPALAEPLDYELTAQLSRGRIDDPRLPHPLTDIRGTVYCSPRLCRLDELTARSGPATLRLNLQRQGQADDSPLRLTAEARQLQLDHKLLGLLPERWQTEWNKFVPAGEVDLDVTLEFDGQAWRREVTCKCLNVAFSYHKFPYRLERAHGTLALRQDRLDVNLVANSDHSELRLLGELTMREPHPVGWLEVRGDDLRIDEKLLLAMPERPQATVRSLNAHGKIHVFYRFWREAESPEVPHQHAVVTLQRCGMRFDKFPYPISDVRGTLEMNDAGWVFRDLEGTNDYGRITSSGTLTPRAEGYELVMQFGGTHVALEEELRDALNPAARQLWNDLKPRGAVNLEAEVRYAPEDRRTRLWVRAQPVDDTVTVEPTYFPYRLENVRGTFVYNDGHVTMEQVRAGHGPMRLAARGYCQILPEGGWRLHLENTTWDRLRCDRELIHAVPSRLKKLLTDLDLRGPVNLRGAIDLASSGRPNAPVTTDWDIDLDLQQVSLSVGLALKNVCGGIKLKGTYDGRQFRCAGEINVDSLTYRDLQFTEVRGPILIDDGRLLVGHWADREQAILPERRLAFRLYGGQAATDGWVAFGPESEYDFVATLERGDLARFTQEALSGRQELKADVAARVQLRGRGASLNGLSGVGQLQLRNADIYELPFMVNLLKILSVRQPDRSAFTASDIDFRIQGEHVYLDRMSFKGNAVSLRGQGEVNLNRQINCTFYAIVGRDERRLPVVSDVLGGASQQILLIHAQGTLDEPSMRREAFPGVNQALQQLQAELNTGEVRR